MAEKIVEHKTEVHGQDTWVLFFCDNLSAHLDEEVKEIFGNRKVFLCYLPPNMTNFIQLIDAGLGRCVRVSVGNFLDEWLMNDDNMEKWETNLTATERRILISDLVGKAMEYVMSNEMESMRISAFRRTGCLITALPQQQLDSEIKSQAMPTGSFSVPIEHKNTGMEEFSVVSFFITRGRRAPW